MGVYCSANTEVRANTGFTNLYGSSSETTPSITEVNYFINQCEGEINLALSAIGITSVTNSYLSQTLSRYSAIGSAGMVLRRYGQADDQARALSYIEEYKEWLNRLISDSAYQKMLTKVQGGQAIGNLTGSAVTQGYVSESTRNPVYGVDNFRI